MLSWESTNRGEFSGNNIKNKCRPAIEVERFFANDVMACHLNRPLMASWNVVIWIDHSGYFVITLCTLIPYKVFTAKQSWLQIAVRYLSKITTNSSLITWKRNPPLWYIVFYMTPMNGSSSTSINIRIFTHTPTHISLHATCVQTIDCVHPHVSECSLKHCRHWTQEHTYLLCLWTLRN